MLLAVAHVASDPGVLVDVLFAIIDMIPEYCGHAGSKILAAFRRQLTTRFR